MRLTPICSAQPEPLPSAVITEAKGVLDQTERELLRAAESWNAFLRDQGSFADEYSTL